MAAMTNGYSSQSVGVPLGVSINQGDGPHELELAPQGRLSSPYFEELRQKYPNAFKRRNSATSVTSRPSSAVDFGRSTISQQDVHSAVNGPSDLSLQPLIRNKVKNMLKNKALQSESSPVCTSRERSNLGSASESPANVNGDATLKERLHRNQQTFRQLMETSPLKSRAKDSFSTNTSHIFTDSSTDVGQNGSQFSPMEMHPLPENAVQLTVEVTENSPAQETRHFMDSPNDSAVDMDNGSVQSAASNNDNHTGSVQSAASNNDNHTSVPSTSPLAATSLLAITKKLRSPNSSLSYRNPPFVSRIPWSLKADANQRDSDVDSGIAQPQSNGARPSRHDSLSSNEEEAPVKERRQLTVRVREKPPLPRGADHLLGRPNQYRPRGLSNGGPLKADHSIKPVISSSVTSDTTRNTLEQIYWNSKGARPKSHLVQNGGNEPQKMKPSNRVRFKDVGEDDIDDTDPRTDPLLSAILKLQNQNNTSTGKQGASYDHENPYRGHNLDRDGPLNRSPSPFYVEDLKQRRIFEQEVSNSSSEKSSESSMSSTCSDKHESYFPSDFRSSQPFLLPNGSEKPRQRNPNRGILKSKIAQQRHYNTPPNSVNEDHQYSSDNNSVEIKLEPCRDLPEKLTPPEEYTDSSKQKKLSISSEDDSAAMEVKHVDPLREITAKVEINNNENDKDVYAVVDSSKKLPSNREVGQGSLYNPCISHEVDESILDLGVGHPELPSRGYKQSDLGVSATLSGSKNSLSGRMDSFRRSAKSKLSSLRRAFSMERVDKSGRDGQETAGTKVKKSPSFRSLKLSFSRKNKTGEDIKSVPKKRERPSSAPLFGQQGSRLSDEVAIPKHGRAIGRLLQLNRDGTQLIELVRPPHGPFGFYIARGNAKYNHGVFVSRLSDGHPEKLLAGLIGLGDEIIEINQSPTRKMTLDQVYDTLAKKDKILLSILPLLARKDV